MERQPEANRSFGNEDDQSLLSHQYMNVWRYVEVRDHYQSSFPSLLLLVVQNVIHAVFTSQWLDR